MPLAEAQLDEVITRYIRERDRYEKMMRLVAGEAEALVRDNSIPATVQYRTKDPGRLRGKLVKKRESFGSVDQAFAENSDFAGVRIATYVETDRDKVVGEIRERFVGPAGGEVAVEERNWTENHYRATHCVVALPDEDLGPGYENLEGTVCEIQVCSLLAHVYNEIQHDLEYKPLTGELSTPEQQALDAIGNLARSGDAMIMTLLQATDARLAAIEGPFVDQWDFVARVRRFFPDASDFGTHSRQLFDEMRAQGIMSPRDLEEQLLGEGAVQHAYELLERFEASLPDNVVRPDNESSDPLLMLFLDKHAEDVLERHAGRGRPARIKSAARRFLDMPEPDENSASSR